MRLELHSCEGIDMESEPSHDVLTGEQCLSEPNVYVSLTNEPIDASVTLARVKSPKAGAVVLFAGMS